MSIRKKYSKVTHEFFPPPYVSSSDDTRGDISFLYIISTGTPPLSVFLGGQRDQVKDGFCLRNSVTTSQLSVKESRLLRKHPPCLRFAETESSFLFPFLESKFLFFIFVFRIKSPLSVFYQTPDRRRWLWWPSPHPLRTTSGQYLCPYPYDSSCVKTPVHTFRTDTDSDSILLFLRNNRDGTRIVSDCSFTSDGDSLPVLVPLSYRTLVSVCLCRPSTSPSTL